MRVSLNFHRATKVFPEPARRARLAGRARLARQGGNPLYPRRASHARRAFLAHLARLAVVEQGKEKAETHRAGFGFSRRGDVLVQPTFLIL